jgi:predicted glutamine amidotransferase
MFAYVSPAESTLSAHLRDDGIRRLRALAELHADGWGWAGSLTADGAPEVIRSAMPAMRDRAFTASLARGSRAAMLHLRWATLGTGIEIDNTHPFVVGEIAFEHNGSLKPLSALRELVPTAVRDGVSGATDSELYFALIRESVRAGATLCQATVEVASHLREIFPFASLNAMLLSPHELLVVNSSARSSLDDDDIAEAAQFDLPDDHAEDYFGLRWTRREGSVLVASSGLYEADWQPLPADTVMRVDLADRTVELLPLRTGTQAEPEPA